MTILMAVPRYPMPYLGGLERQAHLLAVELSGRGHRVIAVSGRTQEDQPAVSVLDGVEIHRVGFGHARLWRWLSWPVSLWLSAHRLLRRADVIHAHVFSGFGLYFILLARLYCKPILVKLPNYGVAGLVGLAQGRLGALRIAVFKLADAVVAMTPESQRELAEIGYAPARVLSTPNGIRIAPAPGRRQPRDAGACAFVFVGRLHEQKGIPDLLAAVGRLARDAAVGPFTVDLIGDGELRSDIERQVATLGLSRHVRLLGHQDGAAESLARYDAFVLPSYLEGNSNAVLEAMQAGLPVVSTRVGGTPMLVGPQGAGLLHEPGDVTELARMLAQVIERPAWRAEVGAAMRRRIEEHFDIRRVASNYERAYRMLAERRGELVATASDAVVNWEE
jgi:glycosyltransferase involved in cell wall biosynthesis